MAISPLQGAFRTHRQYLDAFAYIATEGRWRLGEAYTSIANRFNSSQLCPCPNGHISGNEQVRRSLQNAWGTELLLWLSHRLLKGDEIVRVSNNWNVIQAYYALYHATQAVIVSRGAPRPESHPKTQRMFVDLWGRLPINFAPWCFTVGPHGHWPSTIQIDPSIHAWTFVDHQSCWSIAHKALLSTRADAIREAFKAKRLTKQKAARQAWAMKESERRAKGRQQRREPRFAIPLLTVSEKAHIDRSTRPYSLLDYLYRLRIRANYEDASMFTDGPENDRESSDVRVALVKIVSASLLAAELVLCRARDGRATLREWATRWLENNGPKGTVIGVAGRVPQWTV